MTGQQAPIIIVALLAARPRDFSLCLTQARRDVMSRQQLLLYQYAIYLPLHSTFNQTVQNKMSLQRGAGLENLNLPIPTTLCSDQKLSYCENVKVFTLLFQPTERLRSTVLTIQCNQRKKILLCLVRAIVSKTF